MKVILDAKYIRGAMACQASESEVRKFLKGVVFDGETGEIVGSNGHMMYFAKDDDLKGLFKGTKILKIPQKISKKVQYVEIDFSNNEIKLVDFGVTFSCEVISAIPPSFRTVIDEIEATSTIQKTGISPKYITLAIKALESLSYSFIEFSSSERGCVMKLEEGDEKVIMMPKRVG